MVFMSLVEHELFTLVDHLSSPTFIVGFMLLHLSFIVWCFVDHCLSVCSFVVFVF